MKSEKIVAGVVSSLLMLLGCLTVAIVTKAEVPWAGVLVMSAAFGTIIGLGW